MADSTIGLTWDELQAELREKSPWTAAEILGAGDERHVAMELQAIRVGDTAIASTAGEILVKTGMAVKRRSPVRNTLFAAYTDGSVGYFPLPEDYPRGGYEVDESYIAYRLPSPVAPRAAGLVEEAAVRLLDELACQHN